MKKTVVSVATLTAITGVAATAVSADEYTISSGDTLWGIASEVGTSVADLKADNKLSSDIIFPGDVLTVNPKEEAAPAPASNESSYIVKAGDTLWAIGAEYSLDYKDIMKWNNLSSDMIFVGQELSIDGSAVSTPAETPVVEEVQEAAPAVEAVEEPVVEEVQEAAPAVETVEEPVVEEVQEAAPAVEAVEEPVAEEVQEAAPAVEVVEEPVAEEVQEAEQAAAEKAEADRVAAEAAAAQEAEQAAAEKAEADRVAAEAAAAQEAEEAATEKAEADRVAAEAAAQEAEQAAAEKAEADRVAAEAAAAQEAEQAAAEKAEADRVAAEAAAQEAEQAAAEKAEADRAAAEAAAQEAEQAAAEKAEADRAAAEAAAQEAEQAAAERAAEQAAAEEQEAAEQPAAATPASSASNGKNYYSWGTCAWYVFEKRSSMGMSVGNTWGDAKNWASNAQSAGYSVNNSPSVGAIMQAPAYTNGSYGQGHVAIVERVNGDGSILVSEMQFGGGLGDQNTRTISASQVSSHNFIH